MVANSIWIQHSSHDISRVQLAQHESLDYNPDFDRTKRQIQFDHWTLYNELWHYTTNTIRPLDIIQLKQYDISHTARHKQNLKDR
jgi:hypothetical protein